LNPEGAHIKFGDRCQAKFLTFQIADFTPCAHPQSDILHFKKLKEKCMFFLGQCDFSSFLIHAYFVLIFHFAKFLQKCSLLFCHHIVPKRTVVPRRNAISGLWMLTMLPRRKCN